jgi:hypothetical protein
MDVPLLFGRNSDQVIHAAHKKLGSKRLQQSAFPIGFVDVRLGI